MDRGIRPLNVTLLTLLVTATISGVVAFGVGFPGPARWVVAVHGASGVGLLLLAPKIRVTQWMFDPVPQIAAADWRLRTPDGSFDLAALAALPQSTVRAVLDCTGGWCTEQEWRGVRLSALGLRQGASIEVVSTTGYRRRFPARAAGTLLLATHASGRPLSAGHGGPARIVAPGRRGFWWVKWVASIEVVDEPWWWQPPFPLQ